MSNMPYGSHVLFASGGKHTLIESANFVVLNEVNILNLILLFEMQA